MGVGRKGEGNDWQLGLGFRRRFRGIPIIPYTDQERLYFYCQQCPSKNSSQKMANLAPSQSAEEEEKRRRGEVFEYSEYSSLRSIVVFGATATAAMGEE